MPRVLLLTSHPHLYTPVRLRDELRALDVDCEFFRPGDPQPRIGASTTWILTRAGPFNLRPVLRAQRLLERQGARAFIPRHQFLDAADQWRTLRRLADAGVPIPRFTLLRSPASPSSHAVPGPPWFVKGRLGSKGSHVLLAPTRQELGRHTRFLWGQGGSAIVQADHRGHGSVRRLLVLGDEVLACVRSQPADGEYRSNWHRGAALSPEAAPTAHVDLAVGAVRALGLAWAGVDVIGEEQPVVLELNASPGLEGLEHFTGRNQAREFARFLLRTLREPMQSCPVRRTPSPQEESPWPTRSPP